MPKYKTTIVDYEESNRRIRQVATKVLNEWHRNGLLPCVVDMIMGYALMNIRDVAIINKWTYFMIYATQFDYNFDNLNDKCTLMWLQDDDELTWRHVHVELEDNLFHLLSNITSLHYPHNTVCIVIDSPDDELVIEISGNYANDMINVPFPAHLYHSVMFRGKKSSGIRFGIWFAVPKESAMDKWIELMSQAMIISDKSIEYPASKDEILHNLHERTYQFRKQTCKSYKYVGKNGTYLISRWATYASK